MHPSILFQKTITARLRTHLSLSLMSLVLLQVAGCSHGGASPSPAAARGFRPVETELDLGDGLKFEFRVGFTTSDGAGRLLVGYSKLERASETSLGSFFRISTDGGISFGYERSLPGGLRFVEGGLATVKGAASPGGGSNIVYTQSKDDGETWTQPFQINDEQGSVRAGFGGGISFVQPSPEEVYCLWTDRRRGFVSLFFSASHDSGQTWTPNQAVEYDFREGEQSAPRLLAGARGRLIAIWIDWRDRQTLADIRASYSDDGGQHWSPSRKINDDSEHVWQIAPSAVVRGEKIYVAFQDFRDPGEEGDNDWNIYFARSSDNGQTWSRNVRVNDIEEGLDASPLLAVDEAGTLYCAWKTCRQSLFGHVAFSHSTDGGELWSRSMLVSESAELLNRDLISPPAPAGGKVLCWWRETSFDAVKDRFVWLEPTSEPAGTEARAGNPTVYDGGAPGDVAGDVLFADDFSSETTARWQPEAGVWMVVDGAYMGVEPSSQTSFSSFARFKEPDRYILRGRFKLDPVNHYRANIYFRGDPARDAYYVITNEFRAGAWLSVRDGSTSRSLLIGRPIAERRFPFQNNRWYQFALVVASERVDYYVDGRLMMRSDLPLRLRAGAIGVGGGGQAPTYFDDLVVSEFKPRAAGGGEK
jgi:hypothetical protein